MVRRHQHDHGRAKFGGKYSDATAATRKHLARMTLDRCTPWHNGKVFFNAHAAYTLEMEQSLQAIDASIAMPYWDYTIDGQKVLEMEDRPEEFSDIFKDSVLFTAGVFGRAFPRLAVAPEVLYPPFACRDGAEAPRDAALLLSINRFERKKNLGLAVEALALLPKRVRLVLAGGYDPDLPENVEHARELEDLAARLGVADRVTQRRSVSGDEKARLLARCACLLYTPENEHFGIVPLEAMHARTPVVAVDSGGPRESVVDGVTGRLLAPDPQTWARAVADLLGDAAGRRAMGERGRERVRDLFSLDAFADRLERICVGVLTR